jgi:hypothetical protein
MGGKPKFSGKSLKFIVGGHKKGKGKGKGKKKK